MPSVLFGCADTTTADSGQPPVVSTTGSSQAPDDTTAPAGTPATVSDPARPAFDELPVIPDGKASQTPCPYLDTQWVADANGQRVTGMGVDDRFDPVACVFWSYPEDPQLTVIVRHMDTAADAMAVVDWAAPVDTTNPTDEPAGWTGGRKGGDDGAVYAVAKDTVAVVVLSNQAQSIKTQIIAEKVIENLHL